MASACSVLIAGGGESFGKRCKRTQGGVKRSYQDRPSDPFASDFVKAASHQLSFVRSVHNRVFVRSVMNFVIDYEWFCSIFKLKVGDSSKMV